MAEQKFDPRFDPAFQRGYDPGEHGSESGGALAGASGADGAATVSGETREQHRPEESVPPVGDAATAASGGSEQGQAQPVQPNPAQPNPFERTLAVVAAALVVLGVGAVFWANNANYNGPGETWGWHQALQSLAWALSSPMITVGLATGVGLVFRRAIAWGPRE
jgi:uncharacterized protein YbjT (DUF2867 family)